MTRVTSDVDVLNDLFTSGVVAIFGDVFTLRRHHDRAAGDGLAARADQLRRAAAHRARDAVVPAERARDRTARCAPGSRGSTPSCRRTSRACRRCSCSGAKQVNFARFDDINAKHRDANIDSIFYYAVFYPAIEIVGRDGRLAHHLVRRAPRDGRHADARARSSRSCRYSSRFFRPISDMSEKFNMLQSAMASSERIFKLLDEPVAIQNSRPRRSAATPPTHRTSCSTTCGSPTTARTTCCATSRSRCRPGQRIGDRRRHRLRQDDDDQPADAVLRRQQGTDPGGRRRHPRARARGRAGDVRARAAGRAPVLRHASPRTSASGEARLDARDVDARGDGRARAAVHRPAAGRLRHACSASAARRCRWGRSSCCRSRGRSRSTGRCWCSTRRRRASTPTPKIIIREALEVLMRGRTTVAIAHRLSTIQDMDQHPGAAQGRAARERHAPGTARPARASTSSCISCSSARRSMRRGRLQRPTPSLAARLRA